MGNGEKVLKKQQVRGKKKLGTKSYSFYSRTIPGCKSERAKRQAGREPENREKLKG